MQQEAETIPVIMDTIYNSVGKFSAKILLNKSREIIYFLLLWRWDDT